MSSDVRGRLVVPVVMWAVRFRPGPRLRPGPGLGLQDSTHGQRRWSRYAPSPASGPAPSSPVSFLRPGTPWWTGAPRLYSGASSADQLTLEGVAKDIRDRKLKRVVVMAGAGISTASGIPDFRSPGSGLYDNLQQYSLPYAEAIFDIGFFHRDPRPFFALAKALYPGTYQPNAVHYFIRLLHQKNQLLRMYTQNIDGLERLAGVPPEKLVEAHGTFSTATCTVCRRKYDGADLRDDVMKGEVPKCPICTGVVKPDIVFFGEELPVHFFKYLTDFPLADLLIIMGTSLEVEPFASLAGAVRSSVPRLLINRHRVGPFTGEQRLQDVVQLGDVVRAVQTLVDALGWTEDLRALMDMHKVSDV